jgi:tetratricopeptide (TPR) repeat protein
MNQATTAPNETNQNQTLLNKIISWVLLGLTALLPILIVPLTNGFINGTKLYLLLLGVLLTALAFFFQSFKKNSWKLVLSPLTLPLVLFTLASLGGALLTQNYPVENLLGIGGVYLSAGLVALIGPSLINKSASKLFTKALVVSAAILSLSSLLQLIGWGPSRLISRLIGIEIQNDTAFNLAGSSLVAIQVIALALIGEVAEIIENKRINAFYVLTIPLLVFGIGLNIWTTFIKNDPLVHPISSSWSVALDSLRTPKSALIGQGPAGYSNTFNQYKPNWINGRDFWQANFNSGTNFPLTVVVQLGLIGLAAWILLVISFSKTAKKEEFRSSPLTWMILATFVVQLLVPPNYILLGLQGLMIAFWAAHFKDKLNSLNLSPLSINLDQDAAAENREQKTAKVETILSLVVNGSLTVGILVLFYLAGRAYASSYHMLEAQKGVIDNNGIEVYNQQRRAVNLNPYLDSNRRSYARTNLQIATALSEKTDITEEEKKQVSQLVQQAVREARAASNIDPDDPANWSTLAQVYEELVGSVEGADQWAVNAYVEAIQNAPSDPLLRINLGNILLQQEKVDQASNLFTQAAQLKPDLAAAHFQRGRAQQLKEDFVATKQSWQRALELLDNESPDYQALKQNLEQLDEVIKQSTASGQMQTPPGAAAMQQQQQQQQQTGQQVPGQTPPTNQLQGQTPLGQELPSITDQNVQQVNDDTVKSPDSEPLNLSDESQEVINEQTTDETDPTQEETTEEAEPAQEETTQDTNETESETQQ